MPTLIGPAQTRGGRATMTRGVLFVHSCPRAISPHLEWGLAQIFGHAVSLTWTHQPVMPGTVRTEYSWEAPCGTGARLTSALNGFKGLRFEVTEDPARHSEGERYSFTPDLGLFRATVGSNGDIVVSEDRLRNAMATAAAAGANVTDRLEELLGTAWDEELEPFRYAGDGAPIRYLHRVG